MEDAREWIVAAATAAGMPPTGPVEPIHERPWSTVMRVPTAAGPLWFKQMAPPVAHEPVVVAALARLAPERVPDVVAHDARRRRMLMRDGGERLRDIEAGSFDGARWEALLGAYAQLQIDAAGLGEELVAAGVPDHRPAALPHALGAVAPDLAPGAARLAEELAPLGIPDTVQHDDLHDGQVFAGPAGYRFFDWGDACVSHPFFTLTVTLRVIGHRTGDARGERYRDAYLEPWTALHPLAVLRPAAETARRLGTACRALTWARIVAGMPPRHARRYRESAEGWIALARAALGGETPGSSMKIGARR